MDSFKMNFVLVAILETSKAPRIRPMPDRGTAQAYILDHIEKSDRYTPKETDPDKRIIEYFKNVPEEVLVVDQAVIDIKIDDGTILSNRQLSNTIFAATAHVNEYAQIKAAKKYMDPFNFTGETDIEEKADGFDAIIMEIEDPFRASVQYLRLHESPEWMASYINIVRSEREEGPWEEGKIPNEIFEKAKALLEADE
ncbi:MAG: hypothetical protein SVK08_00280 [Halobacteriota archaeon]|nr:hypothetical protein [Halobacteriota archaeon]